MARNFFVSMFVVLCGCPINCSLCGQEQDMYTLYELDFLHNGRRGNADKTVARYWVLRAQDELRRLKGRFPDELDAQQQLQKENLQSVLGEILDLGNRLGDLPQGPEGDKLTKVIRELHENGEIAESVFEIIGADRCAEIAVNRCRAEFESRRAQNEHTWSSVGSYFKNETFLGLLNLTESQKKSIDAETIQAVKKLEQFVAKKVKEQKTVSERRWEDLLDVLGPEQRDKVETIIGRPVEWFRIPKNNTFDGETTWLPTQAIVNGIRSTKVSSSMQMSADELRKQDMELMDSLVYHMLYAAPLWPEYELVESQEKDLTGRLRKIFNYSILALPDTRRLASLLDSDVAYPDSIKDLLLPRQLAWFQQIELQIRLEKQYDPYVGLLHPKMIDSLALTSDQQASIRKIGQHYLESEQNWQRELESANNAAVESLHVRMFEILTEEQRKVFEKYMGINLVSKTEVE